MIIVEMLLVTILASWQGMQLDVRSATLALMSSGYTPDEMAAAGVTTVEVQNALNILNSEGIAQQLYHSIANHDTAKTLLSNACDAYLQTRSSEAAVALETARHAEQTAQQELVSARSEVTAAARNCIAPVAMESLERCFLVANLDIPVPFKFVDRSVAEPVQVACALQSINRATRREESPDPTAIELLQRAQSNDAVQNAESNWNTTAASIRTLMDTNLLN